MTTETMPATADTEPPEPLWLHEDPEFAELEHSDQHPDTIPCCDECDTRAERTADYWQRAMAGY